MLRPQAMTLLLAVSGVAVLLTAACDQQAEPASRSSVHAKVASPLLRGAVAIQDSLLATPPPEAPRAHEVIRYFHFSNVVRDPKQRAAVQESFFSEWSATPERVFFIELAIVHERRLGRSEQRAELLKAAAGTDTNAAIFQFTKARLGWRNRLTAGATLRRAARLADESDPLLAVWSRIRLARIAADEGQVDDGIEQLARMIRPAWTAGGPALAGEVWMNISRLTRRSGRLDDALASAAMADACALAIDNGFLRTRARLSLGRAHLLRGRYVAAIDTFASCYAAAADSGYVRLGAEATGYLAMASHANGDLDRETAEIQRLLQIAEANADTNSMVRAGVALADALRRAGELAGARAQFDWCDAVNATWSAGDLTRYIQDERSMLLKQMGHYAAAESLRMLVNQRVDPETDRNQALLVQVNLIQQGVDTNRPDLAYDALARAYELKPESMPRSLSLDPPLHLALAAAQLHARQGEYALADAQLQIAIDRLLPNDLRATYYVNETKGRVAGETGDGATTREAFRQCLVLADSLGEPDLIRRSSVRLSAALLTDGHFAAAESLVAMGLDAPEYWTRLNSRLITAMARARSGDHQAALEIFAAADSTLGGDPPADLAARINLERGRSRVALDQFAQASELLIAARTALDGRTSAAKTEMGQSFNRNIRYETAEALLGLYYDHPQLAGQAGIVAASREVAAWARNSTPASVHQPRLEYFIGSDRAFAWATGGRSEEFHWQELASPHELAGLVHAVTTDMAYPGREVDSEAVQRLGTALLEPLRGRWPANAELEIAPEDFLTAVPWAALTWPETGQAVLFHAPFVITAGPPQPAAQHAGEGLLAIGVNGDADEKSPRLAQAEAEARSVAAAWQNEAVDLRIGPDGSFASLLPGGLRGFRAIHISSHARVYEGVEGHSTIHLAGDSGQPLTIGEIIAAGTDAELVYLSNCEGARQHRSAGRGVMSFADAFLTAGAGGIVATSVQMDDDAGRVLAESFYRHWLAGKARAAALRAALVELKGADPRWDHPFYWAFTNFYSRPTR